MTRTKDRGQRTKGRGVFLLVNVRQEVVLKNVLMFAGVLNLRAAFKEPVIFPSRDLVGFLFIILL